MKNRALEFALDFEKKGVSLYMKLAATTDHLLAKQVFYSLASQEVDHAKRIDEIYARLKNRQGWRLASAVLTTNVENQIRKFFSSAGRAQLKKGKANLNGYETAMRMEQKGYAAYQQCHQNAKGTAEKEFYAQLMKEEQSHYETLANVYAFLTGSQDWLQAHESRTWNWMNT